MSLTRRFLWSAACLVPLIGPAAGADSQPFDPKLFAEMRWRMIGPFRGGRTVAATGVPSQPNVFYVGVNNGGVWKTTDSGRVWRPIFDEQPTGSIGALAVAPSDPNVLYVGSGEGLQRPDLSTGDGVYKSSDGGKSWKHVGLAEGQQIGSILVDPRDPERVFVAVLGHPYGPNAERGVFRSTDGGRTWQKVLYKDENTGAIALAFDPSDSRTIYADLWSARQAPWEIGASFNGPGSGLYKSTDGGTAWQRLSEGLPTIEQGLGRIGIAVAPSDPRRLYAMVDADASRGGVYRSDDAGASWRRVNSETRIWGRGGDFAEVKVDPKNAEAIYVANTSTYRSTDAGKSFTAIKGAPGGDDYHTIWINPGNPRILLLASDQGATISVNGGETWSSWYNQPTAQFYHVITDNRFPYWVYGGQQESGSAAVVSRSDYGQITFRDWHPVGVEEYGYVAPDPLHPGVIYGGRVTRFDEATGQVQNVGPEPVRTGKYRFVRTMPLLFSPVDPRVLYLGSNVLFRTRDGGASWETVSPDLTRESYDVPGNLGIFASLDPEKGKHRGVIYTIALSPKDGNVIWVGTDDGLVHVTRDGGKTWKIVTPPALTPWSKVSLMEASHFDAETAYAAVNRFRLDDLAPHVYRTKDGGKIWREITRGIPGNEVVNAVREDPVRRGLLFAGTERAVYVSFDDGENWQSLRLNMPATSIRDLVVHEDDLVVGTHGRSFWILDDITPLRQLTPTVAQADLFLFRPQEAWRVRRNQNTDTPLPPEEPAGKNPPDGAILDYWIQSARTGPVRLEISDATGRVVRAFSSDDAPEPVEKELNVPTYWIRPLHVLSAATGMHRFVWDLREPPPDALRHEYPISAIFGDTPREPLGPLVLPGRYAIKLTAGGRSVTEPLVVKMDPRVRTSLADLARQSEMARAIAQAMRRDYAALQRVKKLRVRLGELASVPTQGALADAVTALEAKAAALEGRASTFGDPASAPDTLARLNGQLAALLEIVDGVDALPTTQAAAARERLERALEERLAAWTEIETHDLPALNALLRQSNRRPIDLSRE